MDPVQQETLRRDMSDAFYSRYTTLAGAALLVYDSLLTLSDEVAYLWPKPGKHYIKWLYWFNKHLTLASVVLAFAMLDAVGRDSEKFCKIYVVWITIAQFVSELVSKWILTLRLVVLYSTRRYIVYSLYVAYICAYGLGGATALMAVIANHQNVMISPSAGTCVVQKGKSIYSLLFICPFVFEIYITILIVMKAVQNAYVLRHASAAPLMHIMFRDGIFYFVAIAISRIALIWLILARQSIYLGLSFQWAVEVVLISRFYIHLLCMASRDRPNTSIWSTQLTTIPSPFYIHGSR